MIVTFISQCEKKALKRTRRVLDSFANRIGNNTWQTAITEEGLQAVQKLLRKTASKNTAVSCHKLKSRKLTELLWVVGKKHEFNEMGYVPVNYTDKKVFIGEVDMNNIYANTNKQLLKEHLFAVGVLAREVMADFTTDTNLQNAAFVAGCWHDIGKLESHFQDWLSKELKKKNLIEELPENGVHIESGDFSWEKYPTHNEISTVLFQLLADTQNYSKPMIEYIKHSIFWHHAQPIRKNETVKLEQIVDFITNHKLKSLIDYSKEIMAQVNCLNESYFNTNINAINVLKRIDQDEIYDELIPKYKNYSTSENLSGFKRQIKNNAYRNLIRTAVISADRLVSSLSDVDLHQAIENKELEKLYEAKLIQERGLKPQIKTCLDWFRTEYPNSERNRQQKIVAEELSDEDFSVSVLNGPAGCGKTKIALEWALNVSAKQIIWICPRVQICQGIFDDLTSKEYLPNAKIEIHTSEFKQISNIDKKELDENDYFTGDVVITTIDQVINSITTHRQISTLALFMNSTVVFDEFHEYIPMSGFNIFFAELIECKKIQQDEDSLPNTLLVSATPNYFFVYEFLDLKEIMGIESFNKKPYNIEFIEYEENLEDETNPMYQKRDKNTFVISNTAITAQKSFIDNQSKENSILTHSKFIPKDRKEIFEKVMSSFKKDGSQKYDILRSGPVVQAALNISCRNMISEMTSPENFLQRLGRLNRFGENDISNYQIAISDGIKRGKQVSKSAKFLASSHELQSSKIWFQYLDNINLKNVSLNEIYQSYKSFYELDSNKKIIESDLINQLKEGVNAISANIFDPKRIKLKKNSLIKIKKHSLRGSSRFVQMAICKVKSRDDLTIQNNYIADENNSITIGSEEIMGYGGTKSNLLEFMKKKHHNITNSKSLKRTPNNTLLNIARDPASPIYVSYTPDDLAIVNTVADKEAIYYVQGINQSIGVIALYKLNTNSTTGEIK